MFTPVPLVSVTLHDSVTFATPPETTDEGFAVNELIVGTGQGSTVTVADWLKEHEPFALSAVRVYVVELEGDSGYLADVGPRLGAAFLERNLLLRPLGNIVYFMPPYAITDAETEWALEQIREVLGAV